MVASRPALTPETQHAYDGLSLETPQFTHAQRSLPGRDDYVFAGGTSGQNQAAAPKREQIVDLEDRAVQACVNPNHQVLKSRKIE
jgi:hypothetical protein